MRRRKAPLHPSSEEVLRRIFEAIRGGKDFHSETLVSACAENAEVASFLGLPVDPDKEDMLAVYAAMEAYSDGAKMICWDAMRLWYAGVLKGRKAAIMDSQLPPHPTWIAAGGQRAPERPIVRISSDDLQEAALRGDVGLVRRLVDAKASVNTPLRPYGEDVFVNLLHVLASKEELPNCTTIIHELLNRRADVDSLTSRGTTPLIMACSRRYVGAVEVLLEHGANPDLFDDQGRSPLSLAIQSGEMSEDPQLRERGALEMIHLLHTWGADLNNRAGSRSRPPIVYAIERQSPTLVKALLELGAEAVGLHEAVRTKDQAIMKLMLDHDANPFLEDENGNSAMEVALEVCNPFAPEMLRDLMGKLEREQHPHMKTLLDRKREQDICAKIQTKRAAPTEQEKDLTCWEKWKLKAQRISARLVQNWIFTNYMMLILFAALFLPDVWIVVQMSGGSLFTSLLAVIFSSFLFEMTLFMICHGRNYVRSLWFWTDLFGLMSVPMDHEGLMELFTQSMESDGLDNGVYVRSIRTVRLLARMARLTRTLKLLKYVLPGYAPFASLVSSSDQEGQQRSKGNSGFASRLSGSLSMRTGTIVILLCVVLPTITSFEFPNEDESMRSWVAIISEIAATDPDPQRLLGAANRMKEFYNSKTLFATYFPYEMTIAHANGTTIDYVLNSPPILEKYVEIYGFGITTLKFNFGATQRMEAAVNIGVVVVIGMLTLISTAVVTKATSDVCTPLDSMIAFIHKAARKTVRSVRQVADPDDTPQDLLADEIAAETCATELDQLYSTLATLEAFMDFALMKKAQDVGGHEISELDNALLAEYSNGALERIGETSLESFVEDDFKQQNDIEHIELHKFIDCHLAEASASYERLCNWDLQTHTLSERQQHVIMVFLLMMTKSDSAGLFSITEDTPVPEDEQLVDRLAPSERMPGVVEEQHRLLRDFISQMQAGYSSDVPFHVWGHAVEVACTTFQLLQHAKCDRFLTVNERFALLVASVGHDIGHPGTSNLILIETRDPLALCYNDNSPLENMHAARLFQITSQAKFNIFGCFEKREYEAVRSTIIEAILHTDVSRHHSISNELTNVYELDVLLFDSAFEAWSQTSMCKRESDIDIRVTVADADDEVEDQEAAGDSPSTSINAMRNSMSDPEVRPSRVSFEVMQGESEDPGDVIDEWPPPRVVELMRGQNQRRVLINSILHCADQAYPLKSWAICKYWSDLATQEFILRGDKERDFGLPISLLGCRETNAAHMNIVNIELTIAPMTWTLVHLIPPLKWTEDHMLENMQSWYVEWISSEQRVNEDEVEMMEERINRLRQMMRHTQAAAPRPGSETASRAPRSSYTSRVSEVTGKKENDEMESKKSFFSRLSSPEEALPAEPEFLKI